MPYTWKTGNSTFRSIISAFDIRSDHQGTIHRIQISLRFEDTVILGLKGIIIMYYARYEILILFLYFQFYPLLPQGPGDEKPQGLNGWVLGGRRY